VRVSPGRNGVAVMASSSRSIDSFFIQLVLNVNVIVIVNVNVNVRSVNDNAGTGGGWE
jgi:hypothetical protein